MHTTGIDVRQAPGAVAAITLGKDMTWRDFTQVLERTSSLLCTAASHGVSFISCAGKHVRSCHVG